MAQENEDIDPKRWQKLAGILTESTQEPLNEEPVSITIGTVALGTALGILAYKGAGKLASMSMDLLDQAGANVERKLKDKLISLRKELGKSLFEDITERFANDPLLNELVPKYWDLIEQQKAARGKRGPEFTAMRKEQKAIAKQLSDHINKLVQTATFDTAGSRSKDWKSFQKAGGRTADLSGAAKIHARGKKPRNTQF